MLPMSHSQHANPTTVLISWSGGKDSSLALEAVLQDQSLNVPTLVTTVTDTYQRISMHGVRVGLLEKQARALGLHLEQVHIPANASNQVYEDVMYELLLKYKARGVSQIVFGDLFLEDIRAYREKYLGRLGMEGLFPLWLKDTRQLALDFISKGFRAILVCVDPKQLDPSFCGREFDHTLLDELPVGVDPCGERGEFHTFVYDGPLFSHPLKVKKGQIVERDGFWFCDLTA